MTGLRVLLVAFILAISGTGSAADNPPTPDPANLAADWWTFLSPKEKLSKEELRTRIDEFSTLVNAVSASTDLTRRDEYSKYAADIHTALKEFYAAQTSSLPATPAVTAISNTYNLTDALTRYSDLRAARLKVETEQEEFAWLTAVTNEERKQQSRERKQYLELKRTAPEKLTRGLELVLGRIHLELKKVELENRKSALAQAREQESLLQEELKAIPSRLQISDAELAEWLDRGKQAESLISSLQEKASQKRQSRSTTGDSKVDFLLMQNTVLEGVSYDVEIGLNESIVIQERLVSELYRIQQGSLDKDGDSARKTLSDSKELHDRLLEQRTRWQRVSERIRSSAPASGKKDPEVTAEVERIHQKIDADLEKTGQLLRALVNQMEATQFLTDILDERLHEQEGWINRSLKDTEETISRSWSKTIGLLGASLFEINETPVTTLGILRVILIITLALWLSKGIRRAIKRIGESKGAISESSLYTFGRLIHYVVLIIGIIIGLSSIGIDFTKFALFASALGVGIGFGLQTLISNFVAGLIILFEKSLKVGDFVELESGVTGEVKEINMRSTLISTNDNIDILVPNSEFVGGRVINWTLREVYRRTHIPFGVAYGTDKELVRKAVLEAADLIPWTLKNKKGRHPQVWFVEFGDSSLNFELVVWLNPDAVKRPGAVQSGYLWEIETKLREYGIEIPFPQRDLHVRSVFGIKDEDAHEMLPGRHSKPGRSGA
jgi:potassium-dependent mechanosensitive channel